MRRGEQDQGGPSWRRLELSWTALGPFWDSLGDLLGHLGVFLQASWAGLDPREAEEARKPKSFPNA